MTLVSYTQNHEDIMLWRALRHVQGGFYVDVGANDPVDDSVTKLFYDRGWQGINVEPSVEYFARLQEQRPRDINLSCAAGAEDGTIQFYETTTRGWSTSDRDVGESYLAQGLATFKTVEVLKLDTIFGRFLPKDIHFLKIDVEGAEASVLQGLSLDRYRPWILVIESLDPLSQRPIFDTWEPVLLRHEYQFVYFDGLNRYYLAQEHFALAPAFSAPPNVLDGFQSSTVVDLLTRNVRAESEVTKLRAQRLMVGSKVEELLDRISSAEATTDQLRTNLQQTEAELTDVRQQYFSLLRSRSWRFTRPLRVVGQFVRWSIHYAKATSIGQKFKVLLLRGFIRAAKRIDLHPKIKRGLMRLVSSMPALDYKLRSILTAHRLNPDSAEHVIRVADIVFDDRIMRDYESDRIALPLPAGQRVLYLYVDHTVQCPTNTGVQRVTRILASSLVSHGEYVRYVKWDAGSNQCLLINFEEREHLARWNGPAIKVGESDIYPAPDSLQIPVSPRASSENHWLIVPEVTHITFNAHPVTLDLLLWSRRSGLKSGFIFYDAIPLRRKELSEMAHKHAQYMKQLLLADVVWPISDWSAKDLLAYWATQESADTKSQPEVQTLPLPGESLLSQRANTSEAADQLILSIGSIETRKNQVQLIHAFELYRKKHPQSKWRLTLVGNLHPSVADEVRRATSSDPAIKHLGHVSDQELDALYRSCAFTVFPSMEEGFGLPILESLWYGKPCICADFGAMAEVAYDGGCLTVDTRSLDALTAAVTRLIQEDDLRLMLAKQAFARPIKTGYEYAGEICARVEHESQPAARLGHVYYWIDATLQFNKNTGIQRVSRQLARALMSIGIDLIPVKWNETLEQFGPVTNTELTFFAKWNGPDTSAWHEWVAPANAKSGSWFFMPDLPLNRSPTERAKLICFARNVGLRCAAVFYDAIPWKMRNIYPPHFAEAHREYMVGLNQYDLVLPISSYSRDDLVDFLGDALEKPQSLDAKIKVVALPGEFSESSRITQSVMPNDTSVTILCVGTVEPRKNHETLLNAFALAAQHSNVKLQLVIAGGSHSIEPALAVRVREFIASHPGIVWEENADDARLRELHAQCSFTVYPSVEEGFGLPILESLWYGKPCICANFGAMMEVAEGGGCMIVDVRNANALAETIQQLAEDRTLRDKLSHEAMHRAFKSWRDYAQEVAMRLAHTTPTPKAAPLFLAAAEIKDRAAAMMLRKRPKLSICISTYNRAEWLATSLRNWAALYPLPQPDVELLVCDNTSTDHTPEVIKPYLSRPDFSYHRNVQNVGMLGNLRETAHHASGEYVWIVGDDDLLLPGSIERVLDAIHLHPQVALVYLNYAFTRVEDARTVTDFSTFFREATPIVPAEADQKGPIREICARNENFFTAIYTLVFRRDHAIRAYSQDTTGRPFSTMSTCIPTTKYVLNYMMEEPGVWIGTPQLIVNMNVSWAKYAPLWILERIPEVYEVAEQKGVASEEIDRWRRHTLPGVEHYFREIFSTDPLNNAAYFSASRLVRRFKHLPEFAEISSSLREIYSRAHELGHPAAKLPVSRVFPNI